jgi:ParB/RepB/Spo0J family partition protein
MNAVAEKQSDTLEPISQSGFAHIPLNNLTISAQNIRRTDRKADLEALAASIKSLGLLQNLSVTRSGADRFSVVAGGRRLAALKALAKQGAVAKDYPVPRHILDDAAALESSLAENVQRVATDAMDEVDAFAALKDRSFDASAIAQRFGCTIRHVDQRLALAALSPKLKAAYRKGDLSLDAARAFCIEPDHARQEAVFKALGKPVTHAANVLAHLTHGRMRGTDKLARFVGLDAYEAAGGSLTRDLFLESEIYVDQGHSKNPSGDGFDGLGAVFAEVFAGFRYGEAGFSEQRQGQIGQSGELAGAGADTASVLAHAHVADMVQPVFDGPMCAIERQ